MSRKCEVCGKGPVAGRTYTYRGIAVKKGGIGLNITGKSRRRFLPNLKNVRIVGPKGSVKTAKVCTRCIKSNKIRKAG